MIVEYFKKHSPVAPEVINNWRITGVDLQTNNPKREEIIKLINNGKLDVPYAKSYNIISTQRVRVLTNKKVNF